MKKSIAGSSRLMLSHQSGNVDKTNLNFNTLFRYKKNKHNYLGLFDYSYGKSFSAVDNRQGHIHLRYSYDLYKFTSLEFFQQSSFNKFQSLTARYLFGVGGRFLILKDELFSLFSGIGSFYEKENLIAQSNMDNPRGNIYLNFLWAKVKKYSITSTIYYQPNLEKFSDNRLKVNFGIETILEKNFTQTISYQLNRDTRAPNSVSSTDAILRAGLGYRY